MSPAADLAALARAVDDALGTMDAEYAQMPFFVRPMVRRGFTQRTGRDVAAWRAALRAPTAAMIAELERLAVHFRDAPARARRGMGARADELVEIERRAADRAAAVDRLVPCLRTLPG